MKTYTHPLDLSPEQRKANLAKLNNLMGRVSARVAADTTQTKEVREINARNAKTAKRIAGSL